MDFEIGVKEEGTKEGSRRCDYIWWGNGMDAKYRQGCQVAETAAAPLSVLGRVSSARRGWEDRGSRRGGGCRRAARSRHWSRVEGVAVWRSWWRHSSLQPPPTTRRRPLFHHPLPRLLPRPVCDTPYSLRRPLSTTPFEPTSIAASLTPLLLLATIFSLWLALLFRLYLTRAMPRIDASPSLFPFLSFFFFSFRLFPFAIPHATRILSIPSPRPWREEEGPRARIISTNRIWSRRMARYRDRSISITNLLFQLAACHGFVVDSNYPPR